MQRSEILSQVIDTRAFQFWVPVITHYCPDGSVDGDRMRLHAQQIRPFTRFWMVAGTTGDGWELSDAQYSQLLDYACRWSAGEGEAGDRPWIIVGALRPTTQEVLERITMLKERLGIAPGAALEANLAVLKQSQITGVTVCAPVGSEVTQAQIETHIAAICEAAQLPVILYQLPQVTHNLIHANTLQRLTERYPQIIMAKDSSGSDELAASGLFRDCLLMVRGAEGRYLEVLKEVGGWYDGWLLSTGNAFAPELAEVYRLFQAGENEKAAALSRRLTGMVDRIFGLAQALPSGSAFSNANRAADHVKAYGKSWQSMPRPVLRDGSRLPEDFIARVEEILPPQEVGYAAG